MSLDAVPDHVPDPAEGRDAPRARPAAPGGVRPRDEDEGRGDLHVPGVPGQHRGVLRPEHQGKPHAQLQVDTNFQFYAIKKASLKINLNKK